MNKERSQFAQKRIDYIVYSNPDGVRDLIEDHGYEAPKNLHNLVSASKQLIQEEGREVVKELVKLHPDTKAILKVNKGSCPSCGSDDYDTENSYCGSCGHGGESHYNGDSNTEPFIKQLMSKGLDDLETFYQNLVDKSNDDPDDDKLAKEVQMTFHELVKRKLTNTESKSEKPTTTDDKPNGKEASYYMEVKHHEALIMLGLTLMAGVIIGTSISKNGQPITA